MRIALEVYNGHAQVCEDLTSITSIDPFLNLRHGKARISAKLVKNFRPPLGALYTKAPLGKVLLLLLALVLLSAASPALVESSTGADTS